MSRCTVVGLAVCLAVTGLLHVRGARAAVSGRGWWVYEKEGRRDPFVFRPAQRGDETDGNDRHREDKEPPPLPPPPGDPEALLRKVREVAEGAVERLARRDFDKVTSEVSDYVDRLHELGLEGEDVHERLVRIRETALRLRARCRAEEAFGRLRIEVTGIIWEDSGLRPPGRNRHSSRASALVNGRLVRRGDVVEGARIEEIRPGEITFRFQGFLVRKGIR